MDEQRARIVALVQRLPGCATVDAALLDLYAGAVQQTILDYCYRADVPAALERTAALMVRDMLQAEGFLSAEGSGGSAVKSVSRGDTLITYQTASANAAAADQAALFLKNHRMALDRWRRMKLPSGGNT